MFEKETQPQGPRKQTIIEKVRGLVRLLRRETQSIIEPEPKENAKQLLTAVSLAIRAQRLEVPFPKQLHVSALGKEFVTMRRYDGAQLSRNSQYNVKLFPNIFYENGHWKTGFGNHEGSKRILSIPLMTIRLTQKWMQKADMLRAWKRGIMQEISWISSPHLPAKMYASDT